MGWNKKCYSSSSSDCCSSSSSSCSSSSSEETHIWLKAKGEVCYKHDKCRDNRFRICLKKKITGCDAGRQVVFDLFPH